MNFLSPTRHNRLNEAVGFLLLLLSLAIWLREGLIKLGPTFIKIGQQFSTRVDVLSPEFIRELEQLQDSVPPFESQDAVDIIERDLKGKVDGIFDDFDREPIAAASLGQVSYCSHTNVDVSKTWSCRVLQAWC